MMDVADVQDSRIAEFHRNVSGPNGIAVVAQYAVLRDESLGAGQNERPLVSHRLRFSRQNVHLAA